MRIAHFVCSVSSEKSLCLQAAMAAIAPTVSLIFLYSMVSVPGELFKPSKKKKHFSYHGNITSVNNVVHIYVTCAAVFLCSHSEACGLNSRRVCRTKTKWLTTVGIFFLNNYK